MKFIANALIGALAGVAYAEQMYDLAAETKVYKSHFGAIVEENSWDEITKKVITFPSEKFMKDYTQQAEHLNWMTEHLRKKRQANIVEPDYTCSTEHVTDPSMGFGMDPVFIADLDTATPTASYASGTCFSQMDFSFEITSQTSFDVTMTLGGKRSALCHEYVMFGNTELLHLEVFYKEGPHHFTFNMPSLAEQEDVNLSGVKVFMTCDGLVDETVAILRTIELFYDIEADTSLQVPQYMVDANLKFLSESIGYNMEERPINFVDIDESLVKSGDFFGVVRLDGTSPMIMYGTGGRFSHCTQALRFEDGLLYIVESQGAGYWPVNGIQRTPFATWVQMARERDYNVAWLPLKPEVAARYDVEKARAFFYQNQGLPYGYHNFLFGWLDTTYSNLPPLMPNEWMPIVLSQYEKINFNQVYRIYGAAMNMRMGTTGLTIPELAGLAAQQGKTLQEVSAEVEVEGWEYYDGRSYVCSAFVAGVWQAAGLFGEGVTINATEFQPYDDYRLAFFDKNFERPQACIDADPDLPYCQIMGKYRIQLQLDAYSSLEPYDHMYESCTSIWPDYQHLPEGC